MLDWTRTQPKQLPKQAMVYMASLQNVSDNGPISKHQGTKEPHFSALSQSTQYFRGGSKCASNSYPDKTLMGW